MTSQGTNSKQPRRKSADHLVITVHGIRTFGKWQERMEVLLTQTSNRIEVNKIDYGYFSVFAFLVPGARWLATRRIRRILLTALHESGWKRIDIVAHSFGTHLVAWSLRGISAQECKHVHTIILAGSVLKPRFSWSQLLGSHVQRVVNDCGTKDWILVCSQIGVLFTGMAGRVGFRGRLGIQFRNRYFRFGHSGYFVTPGFMERWWVPLLTTDEDVEPHDERIQSTWSSLLTWALGFAEPFKIAFYVGALFLAAYTFIIEPRITEERTRVRDLERLSHLEESRGRAALESGRPIVAVRSLNEALRITEDLGIAAERHPLQFLLGRALRLLPDRPTVLREPEQAQLRDHRVYFTSDGRSVVSVRVLYDGEVDIWDSRSGRLTATFRANDAPPGLGYLYTGGALLGGRILLPSHLSISALRAVTREGKIARVWDLRSEEELAAFSYCHGEISHVAISPDGRRVVTCNPRGFGTGFGDLSSDSSAFLWEVDRPEKPVARFPEMANMTTEYVTFSSDGSRICFVQSHVHIWDAEDFEEIADLQLETTPTHIDFAPDAERFVVVYRDREAHLGERQGGGSILRHGDDVRAARFAAFSPNGWAVVTAGQELRIWEDDGALRFVLGAEYSERPDFAAFSHDSTRLASPGEGGLVRIWDTETGTLVTSFHAHENPVTYAAFDPAGARLATAARDGSVHLWQRVDGRFPVVLGRTSPFGLKVTFARGGETLVIAGVGGQTSLVGVRSGQVAVQLGDHQRFVNIFANVTGTRIATIQEIGTIDPRPRPLEVEDAIKDESLRIWDAITGELLEIMAEAGERAKTVRFVDDEQFLVVGGDDTVSAWRPGAREPKFRYLAKRIDGDGNFVMDAYPFAERSRILVRRSDAQVDVLDLESGDLIGIAVLDHYFYDLLTSRDGALFATTSYFRGGAKIWSTATAELVTTSIEHGEGIQDAGFGQHAKRFLSVGTDGTARIWELPSGRLVAELKGKGYGTVTASPDGRIAAITRGMGDIVLARFVDGGLERVLRGHTAEVTWCEFHPDGNLLLTTSDDDGTSRLWDYVRGVSIAVLSTGNTNLIQWAPDGKSIVTRSNNGTVRLWDVSENRQSSGQIERRLAEFEGTNNE